MYVYIYFNVLEWLKHSESQWHTPVLNNTESVIRHHFQNHTEGKRMRCQKIGEYHVYFTVNSCKELKYIQYPKHYHSSRQSQSKGLC